MGSVVYVGSYSVSGTVTSEAKDAEQELCSLCGHNPPQQAPKDPTADL